MRMVPYQHKVHDETVAVAEAARVTHAELEKLLSPNPSLGMDARCMSARVGATDESEQQQRHASDTDGKNAHASAAGLLTTEGGLPTYAEVDTALTKFEGRYRSLQARHELIVQFEALAPQEDTSETSTAATQIMEKLRKKLVELREFWKTLQRWDKAVEKHLRQRPDKIRVVDLQREAHAMLCAVTICPQEHQLLLRRRVDCFRKIFKPLFLIQSIMCIKHEKVSFGVLRKEENLLYSAQHAHIWSNLFGQAVEITAAKADGEAFGLGFEQGEGEGGTRRGKNRGSGGFDPNESVTTLKRLLRAGVLDDHRMVSQQYELAARESSEMSRVLSDMTEWLEQEMPVKRPAEAAPGKPVCATAGAIIERLEELKDLVEELLARSCPYPQPGQAKATSEPPGKKGTFCLGGYFKELAESWLARLTTMRTNLLQFSKCQAEWMGLVPLLYCHAPPSGKCLAKLKKGDSKFKALAEDMVRSSSMRHCLEEVLGTVQDVDGESGSSQVKAAHLLFGEVRELLAIEILEMRSRCARLFLLDDEYMLALWGCSARSIEEQQALINGAIPDLFPGWRSCGFAVGTKPGEMWIDEACPAAPSMPVRLVHRVPLHDGSSVDKLFAKLEKSVAASFLHFLKMAAPGEEAHKKWLAQKLRRAKEDLRSYQKSSTPESAGSFLGDAHTASRMAEHVLLTAERIHWTYIVEAWWREPHSLALLRWYVEQRLQQEIEDNKGVLSVAGRHSAGTGALLVYMLELRSLLDKAQDEKQTPSELVFLRLGWRDAEHLAASMGPVNVSFGWELYGGEQLICPTGERYFLLAAQQLNSCKCPLFQGVLGGTVTQSFASACGLACHQLFVLPEPASVTGLYRSILGTSLMGHWVVIHGMDALDDLLLNDVLKHLASFFAHLSVSLDEFYDETIRKDPPASSPTPTQGMKRRSLLDITQDGHYSSHRKSALENVPTFNSASTASQAMRFLSYPSGALEVRDTPCLFDWQKLRLPRGFRHFLSRRGVASTPAKPRVKKAKSWHGTDANSSSREHLKTSRRFSCPPSSSQALLAENTEDVEERWVEDNDDDEASVDDDNEDEEERGLAERAADTALRGQLVMGALSPAFYIPRVMHPQTAIFVAPSSRAREFHSFIFRPSSFPPADIMLYIHAGLIRAGILDLEAARMLNNAFSTFNIYGGAPLPKGIGGDSDSRRGRSHKLGVAEVCSVCLFAASLRHAHAGQGQFMGEKTAVDEQLLVCEAWLCSIGTLLDASAERELLWRCTTSAFSSSPNWPDQENVFRQNLFNDTLMSQRVAKKDLFTRFYNKLADTLRRKFSFDFFNPMVVQKCLATTQGLLQDRDIAVVGDAGAGKTDSIATLLEAGKDFPDDNGRPLFPHIRVLRVNSLTHDALSIIQVVLQSVASSPLRKRQPAISEEEEAAGAEQEPCVWLVLDGPHDAALFEAVSASMPMTLINSGTASLAKPRSFRILVETDSLGDSSPALASSLALTFIDTERGPTWKDRAVAWAHRLVLTYPEYAEFMKLTRDLLLHIMDGILAFVLYYFHAAPRDDASAAAASAEGEVAMLDYTHQTSCFLSIYTSLLIDPNLEKNLKAATATSQAALESEVRLLIGMSSISSFGSCLFTHQRPRFERYVRETVLDPRHAAELPPLYDLYMDAKTGTFQAVSEIVRLTEPIIEPSNICVATEEFVAFQLRLRRLLAINAPVMLAGTAGSGKSTLLQYLWGSKSPAMDCSLFRAGPTAGVDDLQGALVQQLSAQDSGGAFLAPPTGKRLVLLIDDLHLSTADAATWRHRSKQVTRGEDEENDSEGNLASTSGVDAGAQDTSLWGGALSTLAEWIRFTLESRGFYGAKDGLFKSIRDASFLPSLLSPDSQSLMVSKRFSRHFFLVFMEIPSQKSIEKIFSTVLAMNFAAGTPEETLLQITRQDKQANMNRNIETDTPSQKLAAIVLEATLAVCTEAELATKQRLHGLSRVFWDVAHAFSRVPIEDLRSPLDAGHLWAFVMRSSVLDALLSPEGRRRRVCSAVATSCYSCFGLRLGGKSASEDTDVLAQELDGIAYSCIGKDGVIRASVPGLRTLRKVTAATGSGPVLKRLGEKNRACLESAGATQGSGTGASMLSLQSDDSSDDKDSEGGQDAQSEFSIDSKFKQASRARARSADEEEEPPDPIAMSLCKESVTIDNDCNLMWLLDDMMLCTLLRLCHILQTHPVVCLVGGWTQLPLLILAGRLLAGSAGGELNLSSDMTADSLEKELVAAAEEKRPASTLSSAKKAAEETAVHLLAISEDELPSSAPQAFLDREQRRYFRLGSGALGNSSPDSTEGHEAAAPQELTQERQRRLVVICRSRDSFQALATRVPFVRQTLAATFCLWPPASFQQVAIQYFTNTLLSHTSMGTLPKPQKRMMTQKGPAVGPGRQPKGANNRASMMGRRNSGSSRGTEVRRTSAVAAVFFTPMAAVVETIHSRVQNVLVASYGREFALDFCSPARFASFLQSVRSCFLQMKTVCEQRRSMYTSVVEVVEELQQFESKLEVDLRSMRVSLRLLVEEARRLTIRVAKESELRSTTAEALQKVQERHKTIESRIAAVDERYRKELDSARSQAATSLRQLQRVPKKEFESLASFQHLPDPVVRSLGAIRAVIAHIDTEEGAVLQIGAARKPRCPKDAYSAVYAATGGAPGHPGHAEKAKPSREEKLRWASDIAAPEVMEKLNRWQSDLPLPGWLAAVLECYLAAPDCKPNVLWEMSSAISRMAAWLMARFQCHEVLMRMEHKRQSMGDLSGQLAELSLAMVAGKKELRRAEQQLASLQAKHSSTVQQREELIREKYTLELQAEKVASVLETSAARCRECEANLQALKEKEDSPELWGGVISLAVLMNYSASFGPSTRAAITKELRQVFHEAAIPVPSDLWTNHFLKLFMPETFLCKAQMKWPDNHLFESALASEMTGSLCTLILDPFDQGIDWLKHLHTQHNPIASNEDPLELQTSPSVSPVDMEGEPASEAARVDQPPPWVDQPPPDGADPDCYAPVILTGREAPAVFMKKLQHCMKEGLVMIVQLEDMIPLHGFIGTVVLLLQASEERTTICLQTGSILLDMKQRFTRATSKLEKEKALKAAVRPNVAKKSEKNGLTVEIFSLMQRLEAALPLAHRGFRMYITVPRCPWSASLWGHARHKRTEQLMAFPAKLWSMCRIVSLDPRPVHPARIFLPVFMAAEVQDKNSEEQRHASLLAKQTRLLIVEEQLLQMLGSIKASDLAKADAIGPLRRLSATSSYFAEAVSKGLRQEARTMKRGMKKYLALAGSVALLQCALIDSELAFRATSNAVHSTSRTGFARASRVNVEVDGCAVRPVVLSAMLAHQLGRCKSAQEAVSELLETFLRAAGPQHAAQLRSLLFLESGIVRDKNLASLWDSLALGTAGSKKTAESQRQRLGTLDHEGGTSKEGSEEGSGSESLESSSGSDGSGHSSSEGQEEDQESPESADSSSGSDDDSDEGEGDEEGEEEEFEDDDEVVFAEGNSLLEPVKISNRKAKVKEFCGLVEDMFPFWHPRRKITEQLARLPPNLPVIITHGAVPILSEVAGQLGTRVKDESAISIKEGELAKSLGSTLSIPGTWVLFDMADVKNFQELAEVLRLLLEGQLLRARKLGRRGARMKLAHATAGALKKTGLAAVMMFGGSLMKKEEDEKEEMKRNPSRLFLYCSSEAAEVPKRILRFSFCVQSMVSFLGIRIDQRGADGEDDASSSTSSSEESSVSLDADADEDTWEMSSTASGHSQLHADVTKFATPGTEWLAAAASGSPLLQEILGYLVHRHPLVNACPCAAHSERLGIVMDAIVQGLKANGLKRLHNVVKCRLDKVPDWLEKHVVSRAQPWVARSTTNAMLHGFSPSLVRHSDHATRETLGTLSAKLCGLLQRATAAAKILTLDSPFWLRLELHHAAQAVQLARTDCMACFAAIAGDVSWNQHLFSVYMLTSRGCAIWANGRPLAAWLTSISDHVGFLASWQANDPPDAKPFRLGSSGDIVSVLSSYRKGSGNFHLVLDKRAEGNAPYMRMKSDLATQRSDDLPKLIVEGLHLIGAGWAGPSTGIADNDTDGSEFSTEMPPMVIRLTEGLAPKSGVWYCCPLIIAYADAYDSDLAEPPVAHVFCRSSLSPTICALRGVRLVSYT
eukprot:TRINITY_DN23285_c0_g1_i1.p1 TRINITY_DN23285_c0_g1~~TRINITY_DN23285_c0_g1_i1.p1  ORF type:complete len:4608 (+),score=1054.67 TRINITY_DN23285_c0_g1_i1:1382-13825(+)